MGWIAEREAKAAGANSIVVFRDRLKSLFFFLSLTHAMTNMYSLIRTHEFILQGECPEIGGQAPAVDPQVPFGAAAPQGDQQRQHGCRLLIFFAIIMFYYFSTYY